MATIQPLSGDHIVVASQFSRTSGFSSLPGGGSTIGCVGTPGDGQMLGGM
jgi:hypothetical protein